MAKPLRVSAVLVALMVLASPFNFQGQMLTVTTFAGPRDTYGAIDARGSMARFNYPMGVAVDTLGNLYVADHDNHTIRKVSPTGGVTTLAGLAGVPGSVDGTGSAARFYWPCAVAVDPKGNVYVSDSANYIVRKISPSGVVTTLAGLAYAPGLVDGPGSSARFGGDLGDISIDTSGNLYVADFFNHAIRKITPAGFVTTLAKVDRIPRGVAAGVGGVVYVTVQDVHLVLKITATGVVTTLAGASTTGSADGTGSAARFARPQGLTADADGNVYVAEFDNNTIRKITPEGVVTTLAGRAGIFDYADGAGGDSRFASPEGLATDSDGNVYVADTYNHSIRKITRGGVVTTVAGAGLPRETAAPQHYGLAGNGDGATDLARFWYPGGMAIDSSGTLSVADTLNQTIRKISPTGVVSTLAGVAGVAGSDDGIGSAARFRSPLGIGLDSGGNVYVADTYNHTIRKITLDGIVSTIAGVAGDSGAVDGIGTAARFSNPCGIAIDESGTVYVGDISNRAIRKIAPNGAVTTFVRLSGSPYGLALDHEGNLFATCSDHTVQKITPAAVVTTVAGSSNQGGNTDGNGTAARFNVPFGIVIDSSGTLYVTDSRNATLRKITAAGDVSTIAGRIGVSGTGDGTGVAARFNGPLGLALGSSGALYIVDSGNDAIRVAKPALSDVATIDNAFGESGVVRQLGSAPMTATSWQWSVVRRPVNSTADLSSTIVSNPVFSPDVQGLYTFRLVANGPDRTSITTVDLMVTSPPPRRRAVR